MSAMTPMALEGAEYEAWGQKRVAAGLPLPGPYIRNPDHAATSATSAGPNAPR